MRCPNCGAATTEVTNTYPGPPRRRRRRCKACNERFITAVEEVLVTEAGLRLSPDEQRQLTDLLDQLLTLLRYR